MSVLALVIVYHTWYRYCCNLVYIYSPIILPWNWFVVGFKDEPIWMDQINCKLPPSSSELVSSLWRSCWHLRQVGWLTVLRNICMQTDGLRKFTSRTRTPQTSLSRPQRYSSRYTDNPSPASTCIRSRCLVCILRPT